MRHRITIEQSVNTENESGGFTTSWDEVDIVWAEILPIRADEKLRFGKVNAEISHKITIRYLANLTEDMRIDFGGRYFNIRSIINPQERNEYLEIIAEEGVEQ